MKRTKEDAEITRKNILRAGVKAFNQKGFARTRLSSIAEDAGYTRGAVYHHFENKIGLFNAIIKENECMLLDLLNSVKYKKETNKLDYLKSYVKNIMIRITDDEFFRDYIELLFKGETRELLLENNTAEFPTIDIWYSKMIKIFQEAKERGETRISLNPQNFMLYMISALYGIINIWLRNDDIIDLAEDADEFVNFIFAGIENKKL